MRTENPAQPEYTYNTKIIRRKFAYLSFLRREMSAEEMKDKAKPLVPIKFNTIKISAFIMKRKTSIINITCEAKLFTSVSQVIIVRLKSN